jgi:hypothetical protein
LGAPKNWLPQVTTGYQRLPTVTVGLPNGDLEVGRGGDTAPYLCDYDYDYDGDEAYPLPLPWTRNTVTLSVKWDRN